MNYMEQIAHMLGVKLDEHFDIANTKGKIVTKDLWLTKNGLEQKGMDGSMVLPHVLNMLLVGDWVVYKQPWKPKLNERYYFINCTGNIDYLWWIGSTEDHAMYKLGKVYRTEEEAEAHKREDTAFWQEVRKELE